MTLKKDCPRHPCRPVFRNPERSLKGATADSPAGMPALAGGNDEPDDPIPDFTWRAVSVPYCFGRSEWFAVSGGGVAPGCGRPSRPRESESGWRNFLGFSLLPWGRHGLA